MNERIREFAEHAEMPNPHTPGSWTFNNNQLQFFAELIVRECMDVIDPGVNQVIARYQARQWLAEHFGVE